MLIMLGFERVFKKLGVPLLDTGSKGKMFRYGNMAM